MPAGLNWVDYIAGHPERLPKTRRSRRGSETWADVEPGEYQRVTRNWRRWQRRRVRQGLAPPLTSTVREPWEAD